MHDDKVQKPESSEGGVGGGGFTALVISFVVAGLVLLLLRFLFGIRVF